MITPNQFSSHGYDNVGPKLSKTGRTQDWSINNTVKVGFLTLKVTAVNKNIYTLESAKGVSYTFEPHVGLNRLN